MSSSAAQIIAQVNYYFGPENFPKDAYLRGLMHPVTGWVALSEIVCFGRMIQMGATDISKVAKALRHSTLVEVDETGQYVRVRPDKLNHVFPPALPSVHYFPSTAHFQPMGTTPGFQLVEDQYSPSQFYPQSPHPAEAPMNITVSAHMPHAHHTAHAASQPMSMPLLPAFPTPGNISSSHVHSQQSMHVSTTAYAGPMQHGRECNGYTPQGHGTGMASSAAMATSLPMVSHIAVTNSIPGPVFPPMNNEGMVNQGPFPVMHRVVHPQAQAWYPPQHWQEVPHRFGSPGGHSLHAVGNNRQPTRVSVGPVVPNAPQTEARANVGQAVMGNPQSSSHHEMKNAGATRFEAGGRVTREDAFVKRDRPCGDGAGASDDKTVSDVSPPSSPNEVQERGYESRRMRGQGGKTSFRQQRRPMGDGNVGKRLSDFSTETVSVGRLSPDGQRRNRRDDRHRGEGGDFGPGRYDNRRGRRNTRWRRDGRVKGRKGMMQMGKEERGRIEVSEASFPPLPAKEAREYAEEVGKVADEGKSFKDVLEHKRIAREGSKDKGET